MSRALALLVLVLPLAAQSPDSSRRKVGLALSGGSALGLSHIGVLKWFEEHRIPVDYVAGTSMGGLVGGLFAAGYTAAEMEGFAASVPWAAAFSPSAPYNVLSYRRKEDRRSLATEIEFGLKGGFRLPPGLLSGHEIGLILSRFTAPYAGDTNFDDLPTPFRCVAVDLVERKSVVHRDGSLWHALRSTMSLPGVFAPVSYKGMVLVDGGALNNLPVEAARDMGANYLVAVRLESPPLDRKSLEQILGIAKRTLDAMITDNEVRNLKLANLVITPDLKGFTSTEFHRFEEFIQRGYEAAAAQSQALTPLALDTDAWQRYREERRRKRKMPPERNDAVLVEGVGYREAASLAANLYGLAESRVDRARTETGLDEIAGLGPYSSASYGFVERRGRRTLLVNVDRKSYGPPFFNLGLLLDAVDPNELLFNLGGRLTFTDVGGLNSEVRADFSIGNTSLLGGEYYRRFHASRWFFAPRAYLRQDREDFYENQSRIAEFKGREASAGIDFGYAFPRSMEFRAGYLRADEKIRVSTGDPQFAPQDATFNVFQARMGVDRQDSPILPRRGTLMAARMEWRSAATEGVESYPIADLFLQHARKVWKRQTLLTTVRGGSSLSSRPWFPPFELGGTYNLSALGRGQLRGDHYYYLNVNGLHPLSANRESFLSNLHVSLAYEMGQMFEEVSRQGRQHNGALGLMYPTPIGVFYFGGALGGNGQRKIFFRFGRLF